MFGQAERRNMQEGLTLLSDVPADVAKEALVQGAPLRKYQTETGTEVYIHLPSRTGCAPHKGYICGVEEAIRSWPSEEKSFATSYEAAIKSAGVELCTVCEARVYEAWQYARPSQIAAYAEAAPETRMRYVTPEESLLHLGRLFPA